MKSFQYLYIKSPLWGTTPDLLRAYYCFCTLGLFLVDSEDHMWYRGLKLRYLHVAQVLYPLKCCSSPKAFSLFNHNYRVLNYMYIASFNQFPIVLCVLLGMSQ